ncbi:MAG: phosphoribosylaminoimidazolesuccinocarboxamide synthase [Bacteroidota bacterium]|nr:phosphoribosylaminoimidazolesuccinocarboxamide synthase [Bacteroidota bacterium]MDP4232004.1 phosphoribosylaminoimidazolesuccinocarboxamide synthase [Bacteroidota bacterium]MDP4241289.1 phosphoribosylaminoimidazolesuccinocarboxamide synthase [Bacteroidota bacterium]MDP4286681.1 phosphoribosylaminoimidazolesuccinocarboxamide synthase [Bacteroidota bacterium]
MEKDRLLYEGKAKKLFSVRGYEDRVIQEFKDDATAFNGEKRGSWAHKGEVNNAMASALFTMLEKSGIHTHFIEKLSPIDMLIKKLEIVPLEVIVRNIAAGSFVKRYGVKEGMEFAQPTFEFSYKRDDLGDPLINDSHALAMGLATEDEIDHIRHTALKINDILKAFFHARGILLVDFKLEFGRTVGSSKREILLGDEISPDTCRFWDAKTRQKLDKDRFRQDLGGVEEAYAEMLRRVTEPVA